MILERLKNNFTEKYSVPSWVAILFLTLSWLNDKYGHNRIDLAYALILTTFMISGKDLALENKYRWLTRTSLFIVWFFTTSLLFMSFFGEALDKWLVTKGF